VSPFSDIWTAVERGTVRDVEFFLRAGANVNTTDNRNRLGNTLLHLAAQNNPNVEVLEYLLDRGANINAMNNARNTPLHLAARSNPNVEVVRSLVNSDREADLNVRNLDGRTPWDVADSGREGADSRLPPKNDLSIRNLVAGIRIFAHVYFPTLNPSIISTASVHS
jgi:ankyrin repeat protein